MSARRLLIAFSFATMLGVPILLSARAQTAAQPDDCKRVYGGLGIAYEMCTFQRNNSTIALAGSTYKLLNVASDNVTLQVVRASDARTGYENVLIPYSAIRRVNISESGRKLEIVLM